MIDDLSYSNLVHIIQGENIKGADVIGICASELESVREKIVRSERELSNLRSRESALIDASQKVAKHLNKELPLSVQRQGYIVIVSEKDVSIERNIIQP